MLAEDRSGKVSVEGARAKNLKNLAMERKKKRNTQRV